MHTMDEFILSNLKKSLKSLSFLLQDFGFSQNLPKLSIGDVDTGFDNKLVMLIIDLDYTTGYLDDPMIETVMKEINELVRNLKKIMSGINFTKTGSLAKHSETDVIVYGGILTNDIIFSNKNDSIHYSLSIIFS